ncbi:MAG TPA: hypothetical protein PK297_12540 [Spirochaetota bacterium]|nr:hypothetical protein [Spirochaetota bacterium]
MTGERWSLGLIVSVFAICFIASSGALFGFGSAKGKPLAHLIEGGESLTFGSRLKVKICGVATNSALVEPISLYMNNHQIAMAEMAYSIHYTNWEVSFVLEYTEKNRDAWREISKTGSGGGADVFLAVAGANGDRIVITRPNVITNVATNGTYGKIELMSTGTAIKTTKEFIKVNGRMDFNRSSEMLIFALAYLAFFVVLALRTSVLRVPTRRGIRKTVSKQPFSLARVQWFVWLYVISCAFVVLWWQTGSTEVIRDSVVYLFLLSGGTAVAAASMTTFSKKNQNSSHDNFSQGGNTDNENKEMRQTPEKSLQGLVSSKGLLRDIVMDGNELCLHRLQMVLWTAIGVAIVVIDVVQNNTFPDFSTPLLALMGAGSAGYLGSKLQEAGK